MDEIAEGHGNNKRHSNVKVKGEIYKGIISSAIMYGSECWTVTGMDEVCMQLQMQMLSMDV